MAAVIQIILANLPAIISAGTIGWNFIMGVRRAALQTGEWTAEHDAAFLSGVEAWATERAWTPDAAVRPPIAASAAAATDVIQHGMTPV